MSRVLVTGATGFVGSHLTEALVERGDTVRALTRPTSDRSRIISREVEQVSGELADRESLEQALRGVSIIYHCAARPPLQGTKRQYHKDNAIGTQNLVDVALNYSIDRFVHVSTVDVYGYVAHNGTDESAPFAESKEYYLTSKIHAEQRVIDAHRQHGFPMTILRPCAIYGPHDRNSFPGILKYLSKPFAPLINGGQNLMDLVYVSDVADALILAAHHPNSVGESYNITDGAKRTFKEIITMVSEIVDKRPKFVSTPYALSYPLTNLAHRILMLFGSALPKHYQPEVVKVMSMDRHFSIEKAKSELGYDPKMPLRSGLKQTADWYREHVKTLKKNRIHKKSQEPA